MYSAPGMRSSTSSTVPKSVAKVAQSSCVTPESSLDGDAFGEVGFGVSRRLLGELGAACGVLFEEDAKGAVLGAAGEFEVDEVEAVRGRDAVGGGADCVELEGHKVERACNGFGR